MNSLIPVHRQPPEGQIVLRPDMRVSSTDDRLDLHAILTVLRRRFRLFLIVFATVLALAVFITLWQTRLYTATAQVVLNAREQSVVPTNPPEANAPLPTQDRADTEVEVMQSRALAERVASALPLEKNSAFNPLLVTKLGLRERVQRLFGMKKTVRQTLSPMETHEAIVDMLRRGVTAGRVGNTYVLSVSFTATNPEDAAAIANEYARQYLSDQINAKQGQNTEVVKVLGSRLEELRAQAQQDTARVQQYRIANNLLSTSGASLTEQEISSYNQGVASARAQAAEDEARLSTAQSQLRDGSNGGDVGEALNSSVISGLRARQAEISGRYASLQQRYGSRYPDVLKTRSELDDVNKQISAEIDRVVSNLAAKAQVSRGRLASISGSLSGARGSLASNNRAMVGLDDLTRRAEASQALYDSYLNRYKESVAQGGTAQADGRLISPARVPNLPSSPHVVLNIVLGFLLGIGAGLAVAFVTEFMFPGLTTGEEVEQRLGISYLGGIPTLRSVSKMRSPINAILEERKSAFAEAFRTLVTSLNQSIEGKAQVVLISSALPKEGKTTTSFCLARSLALDGAMVALIDCDLRQRGVSRVIRTNDNQPGLIEVLRGEVSLDEALVRDDASGAYILPVNAASEEGSDLVAGEAMEKLLVDLRRRFGFILIDTAPVLPIALTRVLATKVDAVMLVARWRSTADHAIKAAMRLLPLGKVQLAGIALTRIDMHKQSRFGHGDASFYYAKYKSYYA